MSADVRSIAAVVDWRADLTNYGDLLAEAMRQYLRLEIPAPHGLHIGDGLSKARAHLEAARRDVRFRAKVRTRLSAD